MLHHVSMAVPTGLVEACTAFWGALGFEPVAVPAALAGRARWLERAGTQVHLLLDDGAARGAGPAHVAVVAHDYEAALAALAAVGARVQPRTAHWGAPRGYVEDPAGNLVEVMAWPPGLTPRPSAPPG